MRVMHRSHNLKLGFGLAVALTLFSGPVAGQVLLNDTFADNERLTQNLVSSAHWYSGGTSANVDASSGALVFAGDTTGGTIGSIHGGGLAYFTAAGSPLTLAIGQSITFSFDYSYSQLDSGDWGFTFGLFKSNGSRVAVDNTSFNNAIFNQYAGYEVAGILGPDTSGLGRYKIVERTSFANNLLTSAAYTILGGNTKQTGGTDAGVTYAASLKITYADETDMILQSTIGVQTLFQTNTTGLVNTFDTVGIFATRPGTLMLDNVLLSVTSVPEPSIVALVTLMVLLVGTKMFWRSRLQSGQD